MSNPGSTSAPSSYTTYYDSLLSTTLFNYRAKMVDNIFRASAFLAALRQYGGIEYVNGGERIQRVLMYEANDTFSSYKGYETITVKPQDGITSAFYEWSEIGGTITISRREQRQNSEEAALLNLLQQKITQAEMSIKQLVNQQLIQGTVSAATFVPGNSAKDLLPLAYFLPRDRTANPTVGGNVGNIARATYTWWRPVVGRFTTASADASEDVLIAATTWKALKVGLYSMYNWCSRGADGSAPNLGVCNQECFEAYENSLDQQKQYMDESLATMGFNNVKLKNMTLVWDELVPDVMTGTTALTYGTMFLLNTNFYKLFIDKETDFVTTPFVEPENQTAKTAKVLFMGQAGITNARKLGVAKEITLSITS